MPSCLEKISITWCLVQDPPADRFTLQWRHPRACGLNRFYHILLHTCMLKISQDNLPLPPQNKSDESSYQVHASVELVDWWIVMDCNPAIKGYNCYNWVITSYNWVTSHISTTSQQLMKSMAHLWHLCHRPWAEYLRGSGKDPAASEAAPVTALLEGLLRRRQHGVDAGVQAWSMLSQHQSVDKYLNISWHV